MKIPALRAALACLLFSGVCGWTHAQERAVTDEASLQQWLTSADEGDVLLFTPTPPPDFLSITLTGTVVGTVNNLTIDGNIINGYSGYIVGNNTFTLLDFSGHTVGSIANIEINDGNYTGSGNFGGALTASDITGNLIDVAFRRNETSSVQGGGAIHIAGDLSGNIAYNVHFDSNRATAGSGGAIYVGGDFLGAIDGTSGDVHFDGNHAAGDGGGMYVGGNFGSGSGTSFIYANYFATNTADGSGGGLYVGNDMNADLRAYSFFVDNEAGADGGGLFVGGTINGNISGSPFTGNTAGGDGGGLFADAMIGNIDSGATFENNRATGYGGGMMIAGTSATDGMQGNITANFQGNTAEQSGGAIAIGTTSPLSMTGNFAGSTFTTNTADENGGAIFITGNLTGSVDNTTFTGNVATGGSGGGIYVGETLTGSFVNSAFSDNTAGTDGGAVYVGGDLDGSMTNSTFSGNTAANAGGALLVGGGITGDLAGVVFTGNTATAGDGGAIAIDGDMNGSITGSSSFSDNTAGGDGGAIAVGGDFIGGISGATFADNAASGAGGAMLVEGAFTGDIENSTFTGNTAGGDGGAFAAASLDGSVSGSQFTGNSATGDGGAIWLEDGSMAAISGGAFSGNTADNGGALYVADGGVGGGIDGATFDGNTAAGDGGAIYLGGVYSVDFNDLTVTNNTAGGNGGGIYFATDSAGSSYDITFSASSGSTSEFSGNTSAAGANSFYVSGSQAVDFTVSMAGAGTVAFYDPFEVAMSGGGNFNLIQDAAGSTLLMSGINNVQVDGGMATIRLLQGVTQTTSGTNDFTMVFGTGTTADIEFGSSHTLAILNLPDRDNNTALFDLTNIQGNGNRFVVEDGSTLDITRLLKPLENNRYLLVSGLDPDTDDIDVGSFTYLHPDGYTKVPVFENNGTEIWLDDLPVTDAFDPNTVDPNVVRGENCLTLWLNGTDAGLALTSDQVLALRADFASAVPEAAASLVLIGFDVHAMAASTANRSAFGLGESVWSGFDTGAAAAANPGAEAGALLAGWKPVSDSSRAVVAGTDSALAQLVPERRYRGLRMWSGYMGGFDRTRRYGGYSGYNVDTHGFLTGLVWDGDGVSVGAYGGYSRSDTDFRTIHAEAKTDSGHFGLHGSTETIWGLRAVADISYTNASSTLRRTPGGLGTTRGKVKQDIVGAGLSLAYDIETGPASRLTPYATVTAAWLRQRSFTESGPALAAYVRSMHEQSYTSTLGLGYAHDFRAGSRAVITPSLNAGWKHSYGDSSYMTSYYFLDVAETLGYTPAGCKVRSRERGRDAALIGAAVAARFATRGGTDWGLKAAYNLEAGKKREVHSVFAGAEIRF